MKNDDHNKRDIALASVGVAAGALAAGSPMGALAVVPEAVRLLQVAWTSWQMDRAHRFLRDLFGQDLTDDQLTAALTEGLRKPHVQKAVRQAFRAALDAVGDHVLPALASLVGEYEASDREPDPHFRACCRLLQDVSAEEYSSLVALMRRIAKAPLEDGISPQVSVTYGESGDLRRAEGAPSEGPFVIVNASGYLTTMALPTLAVPGCDPAHATRLFHLLDREGFGRRHEEGRGGSNKYFTIRVEITRRLAHIF